MKRLLIATIATAITGCGPAMWTDCYPADWAYEGLPLQGEPVQVMICEPDNGTCSDTGWYYDADSLYVYRYNPQELEQDAEVCVWWVSE